MTDAAKLLHWNDLRGQWEKRAEWGRKFSTNPHHFERQVWQNWLNDQGYVWLPDTVEELDHIRGRIGTSRSQVETNAYGLRMLKNTLKQRRRGGIGD